VVDRRTVQNCRPGTGSVRRGIPSVLCGISRHPSVFFEIKHQKKTSLP